MYFSTSKETKDLLNISRGMQERRDEGLSLRTRETEIGIPALLGCHPALV